MAGRAAHWEQQFFARRKQVLRQIRGEALLLPARQTVVKQRDQEFPYAQDPNFYYLTGFQEPDSALLLLGNSKGPRSVLFVRERNVTNERWEGERLGVKRAKNRFKVDEVREITSLKQDLPKLLAPCSALHYCGGVNEAADDLIWSLFRSHINPRSIFPRSIHDARVLLAEMRYVKDRFELGFIRHAIDITAHGIMWLARNIKSAKSEIHAAKMLEQQFSQLGAGEVSFQTIIAAGKNATTLHHRPRTQPLWKRELVLIDAGAEFRGYAGDISRTLPVSGVFTGPQADLYDVVLHALQAGVKRSKPDVTLDTIHQAVVHEIVAGLLSLRILKGSAEENIRKGSYRPYFMHRAGHFLGLDVHDIAPLAKDRHGGATSSVYRSLLPGCVITMEPGLYFDAKDSHVPKHFRGIGIRLEEDVLITPSGCEVLSSAVPVTRSGVEEMMK